MQVVLWVKSLHILSVMAWMAGLWYLPRLFIYHTEALSKKKNYTCQTFSKMERRLLAFIMLPAMLLSWLSGFGLILISNNWQLTQGWFHVKLLAVVFMTCYNFYLILCYTSLGEGRASHSGKFFRVLNEIPTFLAAVIVIMVVVRPL